MSGLTWGVELDGDAFVECAERHGAFGADRALLEIGPGYGRILRSCLERGVAFSSYLGLDLSTRNVEHLRASFDDPRVGFELGDAETVSLPASVDTVLASLTFKHLYPSFAAALANLRGQLSPHGLVLFDLIEGGRGYFQWDQATYVREYERPEIARLLSAARLELVVFDRVAHDVRHSRLLVVAAVPT